MDLSPTQASHQELNVRIVPARYVINTVFRALNLKGIWPSRSCGGGSGGLLGRRGGNLSEAAASAASMQFTALVFPMVKLKFKK